jgi:hypothetical protein
MKAVLILVVMMTNNADTPPSVTSIEFNDRQACLKAAGTVDEVLAKMNPNVMVTTRCLDKGG